MRTSQQLLLIALFVVSGNAVAQSYADISNPLGLSLAEKSLAETEVIPLAADTSVVYGRPIGTLEIDIKLPEGKLPNNEAAVLATEPILAGSMPRQWPTQVYHWHAAACRHRPLYFEAINAERYGYSCHWAAQPAISTAHFFGTIPALPYLMTANHPWECQYTLGHYNPGSCPPYRIHWWPWDAKAAAAEAGTIAGLILLFP